MGRRRFFRRKQLDFEAVSEVDWIVAEPANYDAFLFAPVVAGIWRQHELWDGTYSLEDLLDAHEMMVVKGENERRHQEMLDLQRGTH